MHKRKRAAPRASKPAGHKSGCACVVCAHKATRPAGFHSQPGQNPTLWIAVNGYRIGMTQAYPTAEAARVAFAKKYPRGQTVTTGIVAENPRKPSPGQMALDFSPAPGRKTARPKEPRVGRDSSGRFVSKRKRRAQVPGGLPTGHQPGCACVVCGHRRGGAARYGTAVDARENPAARNPNLMSVIRRGDRVTIVDRFGKQHTGRAVMRSSSGGWVLNMGGAHGTPGLADEENTVKVVKGKANR